MARAALKLFVFVLGVIAAPAPLWAAITNSQATATNEALQCPCCDHESEDEALPPPSSPELHNPARKCCQIERSEYRPTSAPLAEQPTDGPSLPQRFLADAPVVAQIRPPSTDPSKLAPARAPPTKTTVLLL